MAGSVRCYDTAALIIMIVAAIFESISAHGTSLAVYFRRVYR